MTKESGEDLELGEQEEASSTPGSKLRQTLHSKASSPCQASSWNQCMDLQTGSHQGGKGGPEGCALSHSRLTALLQAPRKSPLPFACPHPSTFQPVQTQWGQLGHYLALVLSKSV